MLIFCWILIATVSKAYFYVQSYYLCGSAFAVWKLVIVKLWLFSEMSIALAIPVCFFLRLLPIFRSAREIVRWLIGTSHNCAISSWVLSPCAFTKTRNFSQSLILLLCWDACLGFGLTSPVWALRWNHKLIVLRLILNSWLASLFLRPSNSIASITFCRKSLL